MYQTKIKFIILSLLSILILPSLASAQNVYNLGDLDIQLNNGKEQVNLNSLPGNEYFEEIRLANFSDQNLKISLYVSDANWESGNNFLPQPENSPQLDSSKWVKLGATKLELAPQEAKLVSVKIKVPENAGVGKHYAAIMVKYQHLDQNNNLVNIEKGLRVINNVIGEADSKYQIINSQLSETGRFLTYSATILNSGNTNLSGSINLTNQDTKTSKNRQTEDLFLRPGTEQKVYLAVEKPFLGPDTLSTEISLLDGTKTFVLNEQFYFPTELLLFLFVSVLGGIIFTLRHQVQIKKLFAFGIISILTLLVTINFPYISKNILPADLLGSATETGYLTTIKWGHFAEQEGRDKTTAFWNGSFKLSSGKMLIVEKLHNESKDRLFLNSLGNILNFNSITSTDNDGIVLFIKPEATDTNPTLLYKNDFSGEEFAIEINSTLDSSRYIDFKDSQIEISSEIAGNNITLKGSKEDTNVSTIDFGNIEVPIVEIESTLDNSAVISEGQSTEDITAVLPPAEEKPSNAAQLQEEISLLREIIQDIPASPEVLSEYILNSNYVKEVISENNSTTVSADPVLIQKLKDTPITIQEITATPDLNFIFISDEAIELAPQQFSFDQSRTTSQEMGEIVFVQNKLSSWNTYFTISDFVSVSGRGSIPATNVSINPGQIKLINQNGEEALIEAGSHRRIMSSNDQATLVTVTPQGEGESIFSMKPQISLEVPANTAPGTYRAEISIKVI